MEILKYVGIGAVAVLGVAWLVISFAKPSRGRSVIEWAAALAMYVALLALFGSLTLRSYADEFWFGVAAFALLLAVFSVGTIIAITRIFQAIAGGGGGGDSGATN